MESTLSILSLQSRLSPLQCGDFACSMTQVVHENWQQFIVEGEDEGLNETKQEVIKEIIAIFRVLNIPIVCPFMAIELLKQNRIEEIINDDHKLQPKAWQALSFSLLILCYKLNETYSKKRSIAELGSLLPIVSLNQFIVLQAQILAKCNFQIAVQTLYSLVNLVFKSKKSKRTLCMTEYLLQLSMVRDYRVLFAHESSQVTQVLATIKLACHLQGDSAWQNSILTQFAISEPLIHDHCQRLFQLLTTAKFKAPDVYRKYNSEAYCRVADIRLIRVHRAIVRNQIHCQNIAINTTLYVPPLYH